MQKQSKISKGVIIRRDNLPLTEAIERGKLAFKQVKLTKGLQPNVVQANPKEIPNGLTELAGLKIVCDEFVKPGSLIITSHPASCLKATSSYRKNNNGKNSSTSKRDDRKSKSKSTTHHKYSLPKEFRHRDLVCHPRLGIGRVLRCENNGTVIVNFSRRMKAAVIFPDLLEHVGHDRHNRFELTTYCQQCRVNVVIKITFVGDTRGPGLVNQSMLPRCQDARLDWDERGYPKFYHKPCGQKLEEVNARPII